MESVARQRVVGLGENPFPAFTPGVVFAQLRAGGSTNGGAGIELAYRIAADHFIRRGTNRVILCTDGDFNDDTKDAGEIGAGHTVTAIYELVPPGVTAWEPSASVDPLKYQSSAASTEPSGAVASDELLTLKLRYKAPDGETSELLSISLTDEGLSFGQASPDTKFAASVAMFGLLLRESPYRGNATYDAAIEIAEAGSGADANGYRAELIELIRRAKAFAGE